MGWGASGVGKGPGWSAPAGWGRRGPRTDGPPGGRCREDSVPWTQNSTVSLVPFSSSSLPPQVGQGRKPGTWGPEKVRCLCPRAQRGGGLASGRNPSTHLPISQLDRLLVKPLLAGRAQPCGPLFSLPCSHPSQRWREGRTCSGWGLNPAASPLPWQEDRAVPFTHFPLLSLSHWSPQLPALLGTWRACLI